MYTRVTRFYGKEPLRWVVELCSESSVVAMRTTRIWPIKKDAKKYKKYLDEKLLLD